MEYPSKAVCNALAEMEPDLRFGWCEGGDSGPHFCLVRLEPVLKVGEIGTQPRRHYKTFFWECVDAVALFDRNGRPEVIPGCMDGKQPMVEMRIVGRDPNFVLSGNFTQFQMRTRRPHWVANMDAYENLRAKGKALDDRLEDESRSAADKMWYRFRKEEQSLPITTKEEKLAAMKATGMDVYEDGGGTKWADETAKRAAPFKREAPSAPEI